MAPSPFACLALLSLLSAPCLTAPAVYPPANGTTPKGAPMCDDLQVSWQMKYDQGCKICTVKGLPGDIWDKYCSPTMAPAYFAFPADDVYRRETKDVVQKSPDDSFPFSDLGPAEFLPDYKDEVDDTSSGLITAPGPVIPIQPGPIKNPPPMNTTTNPASRRIHRLPLGPGPVMLGDRYDGVPILPLDEQRQPKSFHDTGLPIPVANSRGVDDFPMKQRDIEILQPASEIYLAKPKVPMHSNLPLTHTIASPVKNRDIEVLQPASEIYFAKPKVPTPHSSSLPGKKGVSFGKRDIEVHPPESEVYMAKNNGPDTTVGKKGKAAVHERSTRTQAATDGKLQARNDVAQADTYTLQPAQSLYRRILMPTPVSGYDAKYDTDLGRNAPDGPYTAGLPGPGPDVPASHRHILPVNMPRDSYDDGNDEDHHFGHLYKRQDSDNSGQRAGTPDRRDKLDYQVSHEYQLPATDSKHAPHSASRVWRHAQRDVVPGPRPRLNSTTLCNDSNDLTPDQEEALKAKVQQKCPDHSCHADMHFLVDELWRQEPATDISERNDDDQNDADHDVIAKQTHSQDLALGKRRLPGGIALSLDSANAVYLDTHQNTPHNTAYNPLTNSDPTLHGTALRKRQLSGGLATAMNSANAVYLDTHKGATPGIVSYEPANMGDTILRIARRDTYPKLDSTDADSFKKVEHELGGNLDNHIRLERSNRVFSTSGKVFKIPMTLDVAQEVNLHWNDDSKAVHDIKQGAAGITSDQHKKRSDPKSEKLSADEHALVDTVFPNVRIPNNNAATLADDGIKALLAAVGKSPTTLRRGIVGNSPSDEYYDPSTNGVHIAWSLDQRPAVFPIANAQPDWDPLVGSFKKEKARRDFESTSTDAEDSAVEKRVDVSSSGVRIAELHDQAPSVFPTTGYTKTICDPLLGCQHVEVDAGSQQHYDPFVGDYRKQKARRDVGFPSTDTPISSRGDCYDEPSKCNHLHPEVHDFTNAVYAATGTALTKTAKTICDPLLGCQTITEDNPESKFTWNTKGSRRDVAASLQDSAAEKRWDPSTNALNVAEVHEQDNAVFPTTNAPPPTVICDRLVGCHTVTDNPAAKMKWIPQESRRNTDAFSIDASPEKRFDPSDVGFRVAVEHDQAPSVFPVQVDDHSEPTSLGVTPGVRLGNLVANHKRREPSIDEASPFPGDTSDHAVEKRSVDPSKFRGFLAESHDFTNAVYPTHGGTLDGKPAGASLLPPFNGDGQNNVAGGKHRRDTNTRAMRKRTVNEAHFNRIAIENDSVDSVFIPNVALNQEHNKVVAPTWGPVASRSEATDGLGPVRRDDLWTFHTPPPPEKFAYGLPSGSSASRASGTLAQGNGALRRDTRTSDKPNEESEEPAKRSLKTASSNPKRSVRDTRDINHQAYAMPLASEVHVHRPGDVKLGQETPPSQGSAGSLGLANGPIRRDTTDPPQPPSERYCFIAEDHIGWPDVEGCVVRDPPLPGGEQGPPVTGEKNAVAPPPAPYNHTTRLLPLLPVKRQDTTSPPPDSAHPKMWMGTAESHDEENDVFGGLGYRNLTSAKHEKLGKGGKDADADAQPATTPKKRCVEGAMHSDTKGTGHVTVELCTADEGEHDLANAVYEDPGTLKVEVERREVGWERKGKGKREMRRGWRGV